MSVRFGQRISPTFIQCGESRNERIILAVVHAKLSQDTRVLARFHPAADVFNITSLRRTRLPRRTTLGYWVVFSRMISGELLKAFAIFLGAKSAWRVPLTRRSSACIRVRLSLS